MPGSDDDLLGGVPDASVSAPVAANGGDPAVWTLLGETSPSDPQGQLAVASTIANRAAHQGRSFQDVVSDPANGYEAWISDGGANQKRYPVGSPAYQQAQQLLSDIQAGKVQPLPYTHFYGPQAQANDKRSPPKWSIGQTGTDIAGNRFYTLPDQIAGAPNDIIGGVPDASNAPSASSTSTTPSADPFSKAFGQTATPGHDPNALPLVDQSGKTIGYASGPQSDTVRGLLKAGRYDASAPEGSETHPYAYPSGTQPVRGGTWYIDHDTGKLAQYQDPDSPLSTISQIGQDLANPGMAGVRQGLATQGMSLGPSDPRANAIESGFTSGALLGGKNELGATVGAVPGLFNGQGYTNAFTRNLAASDAADQALRERFPISHDTGAVAGAVGSALTGDAAGGLLMRGLAAAVPEAADAIGGNALLRIPAKIAARGAVGAGYGAGQGYLAGGPGVTEAQREQGAGQGATAGAILGTTVPLAGDVLGTASKLLTVGKNAAPDAASRVGNALINAIQRDGQDPADVIAAAKANPDAPAFHAGGPNVKALAQTAAIVPGPAMATVRGAIEDHMEAAPAQVKADIGTALGGKGDYLDTLNNTITARRVAANQSMGAIDQQPVQLNENSALALRSPLAQTAVKNAAGNALSSADPAVREAGANLNRIADTVLDNPSAATMTVRNAQDISKSLLDAADSAYKGGDGSRGLALKTLGRAIRDNAADPAQGGNAAYGSWLSKYGDDSDNIAALQLGHDAPFSGAQSKNAAQVAQTLSGMGSTAQDYYRKGVAEAMIDQVRQKGVLGLSGILKNEDVADKVRAAFPDQASYDQFLSTVKQRVGEQRTNSSLLSGSPTAPRQFAKEDLESQPVHAADIIPHALEIAGHVVTGNAPALAGKGLRVALANIPRSDRSIIGDPVSNALLGKALTDPDALESLVGKGGQGGNRLMPTPGPKLSRIGRPLAVQGANLLLHPPRPLPQGPVAVPPNR